MENQSILKYLSYRTYFGSLMALCSMASNLVLLVESSRENASPCSSRYRLKNWPSDSLSSVQSLTAWRDTCRGGTGLTVYIQNISEILELCFEAHCKFGANDCYLDL